MTHYESLISTFTKLNPTHVETLMLADHRTLDSLPASTFERYARRADRMGAAELEAFHKAEVGI